jgi:hypothetical protein
MSSARGPRRVVRVSPHRISKSTDTCATQWRSNPFSDVVLRKMGIFRDRAGENRPSKAAPPRNSAPRDNSAAQKGRELRAFSINLPTYPISRTGWLRRQDSNLRMPVRYTGFEKTREFRLQSGELGVGEFCSSRLRRLPNAPQITPRIHNARHAPPPAHHPRRSQGRFERHCRPSRSVPQLRENLSARSSYFGNGSLATYQPQVRFTPETAHRSATFARGEILERAPQRSFIGLLIKNQLERRPVLVDRYSSRTGQSNCQERETQSGSVRVACVGQERVRVR